MHVLNHKLWRDWWAMRGQVFAIALVITGGVATYIMSASTLTALRTTQADFYAEYRFAEVFAELERAPLSVAEQIRAIPGVQEVQTRVSSGAILDVPAYALPIASQFVSVPEGPDALNRLFLRKGQFPNPQRDDEVIISDSFADAHSLGPGDTIKAILNGRLEELRVSGVGLAPDYVFQLSPASLFPDPSAFGLIWMANRPLSAAFNQEGAFNAVSLSLTANASPGAVIDQLDRILAPYGGRGAYGREDQLSNRYLESEFQQLGQLAGLLPAIFLGVAAFLMNVVISRLVGTEREVIATLKAYGYSNTAVGWHYLKFVLLIVVLGTAAGIALGMYMGRLISNQYMEYYRFPSLLYGLQPMVLAKAFGITTAASVLGAVRAVFRAVRLAPAQAMRPEPPTRYRPTLLERLGFQRWLSQPAKMILRDFERRPVRMLVSILGVGFACGILILGTFFLDAIDYAADYEFKVARKEDLSVTFIHPLQSDALFEALSIPGVRYAEGFRAVPVKLRNGNKTFRTQIEGSPTQSKLHKLFGADRLQRIEPPSDGIVLTDYLAQLLGVMPGDTLQVEVLEKDRPVRQVTVTGLSSQLFGVGATMELRALNRLLREGPLISGVSLATSARGAEAARKELKNMPLVAGVLDMRKAEANFYETMGRQLILYVIFSSLFAAAIAFGVVYNSARISLAERSRELASLRVLGMTRGEISTILLGELGLVAVVGIPIGLVLGWALSLYLNQAFQTDLFRIPLIIERSTYAVAAAVVLGATIFSALVVRRHLDRLDLVAVLKTKE